MMALGWFGFAIYEGVMLVKAAPEKTSPPSVQRRLPQMAGNPGPNLPSIKTLAKGQPVFVDFTAAWCVKLQGQRSGRAWHRCGEAGVSRRKNVALFRADWTHADPEISKTLQKFNRDGVPLYLLYSPKSKDAPQQLPDGLITPGMVFGCAEEFIRYMPILRKTALAKWNFTGCTQQVLRMRSKACDKIERGPYITSSTCRS